MNDNMGKPMTWHVSIYYYYGFYVFKHISFMFIGGDAATFAAVYENISMVLIYAHTKVHVYTQKHTHIMQFMHT